MCADLAAEPIYKAVLDSYHRCDDADGFFDTFYEIFLAKSLEIRRKFVAADMRKQKQMVQASLLWMLRLGRGDPIAFSEVEKIGESHSRRGHNVSPHMYSMWLDALCAAVERHDPEYTPLLESQWRAIMEEGIDLIVSKY